MRPSLQTSTDPERAEQAELVAQALRGDQVAFGRLLDRHKHWLYRYVRRYVADPDDAYDVLQEAAAAAWFALRTYDPARAFEPWLRTIALNKCRDRARRQTAYRAVLGVFGRFRETVEPVDPELDPEARTAASETARAVRAAIDRLPASLKDPLILTALEGLSHQEAGDVLRLNAKAVEVRVYRAKKQLAALLGAAADS